MRQSAFSQFSDTGGEATSQQFDEAYEALGHLDTGDVVFVDFGTGQRSRTPPLSWSQPAAQRTPFKAVCEDIVALAAARDGTWAAAKEDLRCRADREGFLPSTLKVLGFLLKHINLNHGRDWHPAEAIAEDLGLSIKSVELAFRELGQKRARYILREVRDDVPTKGTQATRPWHTTIPMLLVVAKEVTARRKGPDTKFKRRTPPNLGVLRGKDPSEKGGKDPSEFRGKLEQEELEPIVAAPAAADTTKGSTPKGKKTRSQIAPDWQPMPELVAWVMERYLATDAQVAEESRRFRDHHRAKGSSMADWSAAWRSWWDSPYQKRFPPRQPASGAAPSSDPNSIRRILDGDPELAWKVSEPSLLKAYEGVPEAELPRPVRDRLRDLRDLREARS
ncbi:MAG TPA: hypothetical protein VH519_05470 [Hyphomicrobiaceae bacterium]|jgi:hypothetical protein